MSTSDPVRPATGSSSASGATRPAATRPTAAPPPAAPTPSPPSAAHRVLAASPVARLLDGRYSAAAARRPHRCLGVGGAHGQAQSVHFQHAEPDLGVDGTSQHRRRFARPFGSHRVPDAARVYDRDRASASSSRRCSGGHRFGRACWTRTWSCSTACRKFRLDRFLSSGWA